MPKDTQTEPTVGTVAPKTIKLDLPPGGFRLEKGGVLPEIEVTYERCGNISPANDNVVFICHALTGDAHVAGLRPGEIEPSGWWEGMIGPGRGIDTDRYQVVCANILGGCKGTTGPCSINPATGKPYGSAFPKVTVGDIIEVHRLLLRQIGVTRLAAVMGGSFGGMQVLEWLIRYSGELDKALVIASAASLNSQALAFDIVGRHAIIGDPNWNAGDYYGSENHPTRGLSSARKLAHITYLSQQLMEAKFGREKRPEWLTADPDFRNAIDRNFGTFFQVESYLQYQAEKFIQRFDANSYLHITLAMDEYDIAERYKTLDAAFANVSSRVLIVSLSGDWLFMPEQSEDLVTALLRQKKRVSYCHLDAAAGHDAFLTHISDLKRVVAAFMPSDSKQQVDETNEVGTFRRWQLRHYQKVVDLIPPNSRVLDLGCGNGSLLNILKQLRGSSGNGVEIDIDQVISTLDSGSDVLREDIDDGLAMIPNNSFDVAILSETLQTIKRPRELLQQILRVAREAVITFPNFACLEVRRQLLFQGRMPKGKQIPFEWYNTPNIHLFTLKDFLALCRDDHIEVLDLICQGRGFTEKALLALGLKNLGASRVIVRIAKDV
ncbi:MAG TPA: homoserine O-acetyltransferase [Kiritimatiellia bacterium]|nr:homoserine O-acetyltransferase [Kiritimatiellia bacterium]HPS09040.1 homoserine O-acetyltransferase [Kiritimatiellia bacterium]